MRIVVTSALLFCAVASWAQGFVPQAALAVEEVPIPSAVSSEIEAVLGAVPSTYRVYVELEENWELQFVFGTSANPAFANANQSFYHNPSGGGSTLQINQAAIGTLPALGFDSWLTIGLENSIGNTMIELPDETIFEEWEAGADLQLVDFFGEGLFIPTFGQTPQNYPDANGRILIGQFTVGAPLDGCFNLQFRKLNPDGTIFQGGTGPNGTVSYTDFYCFNTSTGSGCQGDLDNSGGVTAVDILIFLADFGCTGNCQADFTGDGVVNATDLVVLLSLFGQTCPATN
jgi:hypothetical protein